MKITDEIAMLKNTHLMEWLKQGYGHCQRGSKDWCEGYLNSAHDYIMALEAAVADVPEPASEAMSDGAIYTAASRKNVPDRDVAESLAALIAAAPAPEAVKDDESLWNFWNAKAREQAKTIVQLRERLSALGAMQDDAALFESAGWYYRTMDPDDCGDSPDEAINRGMVGQFVVCEIASSFQGPTRFGFVAPVLDPESDDEEFLHFATQDEAIVAASARRAALNAEGK